ncbi:MarR family winged helix-turn-helix transcriptional regulator [Psychromicrobium sp. YIM B11713]|uniref:MarR family winged helix-turn-helix transcriptional regulator n=1 Tax=Psychromicrobium sp. YIM B11713 TaxID=3145233 RepID=UPI00374F85BF
MDEVEWLSTQERRTWLALISTFWTLPREFDSLLLRRAKLTLFDYTVLVGLSEVPDGQLPMSELASRTMASLSRLSHVVSKLERRGLLIRSAHEEDGRVTTASITNLGRELLQEVAPDHVAHVRQLVFEQLSSAESVQLDKLLRKVLLGVNPKLWTLSDEATMIEEK